MVVAAAGFADLQDRDEMGTKDDSRLGHLEGRAETTHVQKLWVGTRLAYYIKDTL